MFRFFPKTALLNFSRWKGKKCYKIFITLAVSRGRKRVTSGGIHLRVLAPGQHSSEETSQQWRTGGATVSDLTGVEIEPLTPAPLAMFLTPTQTGKVKKMQNFYTVQKAEKLGQEFAESCFLWRRSDQLASIFAALRNSYI